MYNRKILSGTNIRKLISERNNKWRNYVPCSISEFIKNINGISRIVNIKKKDI